VGRRGRAAGDRAVQAALRRRARERAAACRGPGQHGGLHGGHEARRHAPRDEPHARRSPDARGARELQRPGLPGGRLRCARGGWPDRLRPGPGPGAEGAAAGDRGGCQRLSASDRLRGVRVDRAGGGCRADRRHGAHCGAGGRGGASEPCAARGHRDVDDAQDAAGSEERVHRVQGSVREGGGQAGVPGASRAGR